MFSFFYQMAARLIVFLFTFRSKTWQKEVDFDLRNQSLPEGVKYWFHGASLGEVKGVVELVSELGLANEEALVTCQTKVAYEFLNEFYKGEPTRVKVAYHPLDLHSKMRPLQKTLKHCLIFENEIWPGQLSFCDTHNVPTTWVSSTFNDSSKKILKLMERLGYLSKSSFQLSSGIEISETLGRGLPCGPKSSLKKMPCDEIFQNENELNYETTLLVSVHLYELDLLIKILRAQNEKWITVIPRNLKEASPIKSRFESVGISTTMIEEFGVIPNYVKEAKVIYYGGSFVSNPTNEHKGLHDFFEGLAFSKRVNLGPFLYPLKAEVDELAIKGLVRVLKTPLESPIEAKMSSEEKQELKAYIEKRIKQRHDAIQWLQRQISL